MQKTPTFLFLVILTALTFSFNSLAVAIEDESTSSETATIKERLSGETEGTKERIGEIREKTRAEFKTKREEFSAKVQKVRDTKRKEILTRLVTKFDTLNERSIAHWTKVLDRLTGILDKLDEKAEKLKAAGADVSDYEESAAEARQKIADAEAQLEEQAAKGYVFEIGTDAALGKEVSSVTAQFRTDMQTSHTALKEAKDSVHTAFSMLKKLEPAGGQDEE